MSFEDSYDSKMEEELDRCLKEQIDNAKKYSFFNLKGSPTLPATMKPSVRGGAKCKSPHSTTES